jgi:hypothetical protein
VTVCDQVAVFDPPADRTGGDAETFCHLGDREKLDLIVAMAATVGGAFPIWGMADHAAVPAGRAAGSKNDLRNVGK